MGVLVCGYQSMGPHHHDHHLAYLAFLSLLVLPLLQTGSAEFIRFQPNNEYIYEFHSQTELKLVRNMTAMAKVGVIVVEDKDPNDMVGHQELYLNIHYVTVSTSDQTVQLKDHKDFDDWFSFKMAGCGQVMNVYHMPEEDPEVIMVKKGIVSVLSANFKKSEEKSDIWQWSNEWSYVTNETGQEGDHVSYYEAHEQADGIKFRKRRATSVLQYADDAHEKEVFYHKTLKVPTSIKIKEHVHAFGSVPQGSIKTPSTILNRQYMVDALGSLKSTTAQNLLVALVLKSSSTDVNLIDSVLVHAVGKGMPPSQYLLKTIEDMAFHPENYEVMSKNNDIIRTAVLVLGALAGDLWEAGHSTEAVRIVAKIEDRLEIHDPWKFRQETQHLSATMKDKYYMNTVAYIEALGNAALERSFDHIHSYTNTSSTPSVLKRAGLHSLRDYHEDRTGHILLRAATEDEDDSVRYEASLLYRAHPHGKRQHLSTASNGSVSTSLQQHHRSKRGLFDGIHFQLKSPSYDWQKRVGGPKCGGSFGLTVRNILDLKIAPLSGHLKIDCFDEAFARVHLGFLRMNVDLLLVRFCFRGNAEYNLNILKEFGVSTIKDITKIYDLFMARIVGNIRRAVDTVKALLKGDKSLPLLFEEFVNTLEAIPEKLANLRKTGVEATQRLMRLDPDYLPPSIKNLRSAVQRTVNLYNDIRSDVMEFYQTVSEAITITLPWAAETIWEAVEDISKNIPDLISSPKTAIAAIFKGVINIKSAVDAILDAKKKTTEASFFLEANRPYWWDLPTVLSEILGEVNAALSHVSSDLTTWVKKKITWKDPVKLLTGGILDTKMLRLKVKQEIEDIITLLIGPIDSIKNLLKPFQELYSLVFDTIKAVKEAYQTLRDGYHKSRSLINKLFGPKVHRRFPRTYRLKGGGCTTDGFYPTDTDGTNDDQGVDLVFAEGSALVSPFPGDIRRTPGKSNQVELYATGGSFRHTVIIISNVSPNDTIEEETLLQVSAGQVIGQVSRSPMCSGAYNHIHFSIKKTKKNRLLEVLDNILGDDESNPEEEAESEGYVDPTDFLENRPIQAPKWIQECDDYRFVIMGETIKAGSVLGGSTGKQKSTSPERTSPPDTSTTPLIEQGNRKPAPDNSISQAAKSMPEEEREDENKKLGLPNLLPGLNPFKNFTIRKLKIGAILAFLDRLGLDETKNQLIVLIKAIRDLVSNKACILPESLTDEQLTTELQQRGLSASGSREQLLARYRQPEDRCPLMLISVPNNIYCRFDPSCLGLECCMNIKLFMISLSFKVYARIDPCELEFVMGLNSWNYTVSFKEYVEWGKDINVPFDVPLVDDVRLILRVGIQKNLTLLLVNMEAGFCSKTDDDECLVFVDILKDVVILLPICHPDGTIEWPDINLTDYFSREALLDRLKEEAHDVLQAGIEEAVKAALRELGLPESLLDGSEPCPRPDSMSVQMLTTVLEDKGLSLDGTRAEKEARLILADTSCSVLGTDVTLPSLPPNIAKIAYVSLSDNCLMLEICLTINLPYFMRAFRAFIELDPCQFTFAVGFEILRYEYLLFGYKWGQPAEVDIGAINIGYTIDKLEDEKVFVVDLSAKVCINGPRDCILDVSIVEDHKIPIPLCNNNFSLALPGGFSASEFISKVGMNAARQAVEALLQFIGLSDKVSLDEVCDQQAIMDSQGDCSSMLPSLASTLTCALNDHCLGVRCCMEVDLNIVTISANAWFILDPCEFIISVGFGKWSVSITLFEYHWGDPQTINIGSALKATVIIDKLIDKKVFIVDFAFSVCLPDDDTCLLPSIAILTGARIPIPLCNSNFSLGGTLSDLADELGENAGPAAIDAALTILGLSEYIGIGECERPQIVQDGWSKDCPWPASLPKLPPILVCTYHEKCLGVECCVELDIKVATLSTGFRFILDPCQFEIYIGLGTWTKTITMFTYGWGSPETFHIGKAVTIEYTIDKLDDIQSFSLDIDFEFCVDDECASMEILDGTIVPIPFCNPNATITLPGNGSIASFAGFLKEQITDEAIQAVLRKLGLEEFVFNSECEFSPLIPVENDCPLIQVPSLSDILVCTVADKCLGISCCLTLDIIVTKIHLSAAIIFDPCEFVLSLRFGKWVSNITLIAFDWERNANITSEMTLYTINKLLHDFEIDLSVELCIDEVCKVLTVLDKTIIPIPVCNGNFTLPGGDTINEFLEDVGQNAEESDIRLVLEYFGLSNFISTDQCTLPSRATQQSCTDVSLPPIPGSETCVLHPWCLGVECCLNMDFRIAHITSQVWWLVDPCKYSLSIGIGTWFRNISLFSHTWGTEEISSIGNAITVSYNIDKLDAEKVYQVDLSFQTNFGGVIMDYPLLSETQFPIPFCMKNFTRLPGDGTIQGFLDVLGENVGRTAINLVLAYLGLEDIVGGTQCSVENDLTMFIKHECPHDILAGCPTINVPFYVNTITCSVLDKECLGVECCVKMDFKISELWLHAFISLDPCGYQFSIGFENWRVNNSLFTYTWNTWKYMNIGSYLTMSYSINKLPEIGVFKIDLILNMCIDGSCMDISVFKGIHLPIPACEIDPAMYPLPGNGTLAGFLEELGADIGDSAIELVLEKLGLHDLLNKEQCELGLPGSVTSGCPSITMGMLSPLLSCDVLDSCSGIRCCANADFKIIKRNIFAWANLDFCNFEIAVGFEKWSIEISLFGYQMGDTRKENISDILQVMWSVDKLSSEKVFQIDLRLGICIEGDCVEVIILDGIKLPIPICDTNAEFKLPGDGSVSGFLSEIGSTSGIFAVDAVLRHLDLQSLLSGKACSINGVSSACSPDILLSLGVHDSCAVIGDKCTGVQCCLDLDLIISTASVSVWVLVDPCSYRFSVGFENWVFNGSVFNYVWGDQKEFQITKSIAVRFTIRNNDTAMELEINFNLEVCIDGTCVDIVVLKDVRMPIPVCNPDFADIDYNLSADGFVETLDGAIIKGATVELLSELGINPGLFREGVCDVVFTNATLRNCPYMQIADDLPTGVRCKLRTSCFGIDCCLDLQIGTLKHLFRLEFNVDPCLGKIVFGFENWSYKRSVTNADFGISQEIAIGNVFNFRWSLEVTEGMLIVSMGFEVCTFTECSGHISFLDESLTPLPHCYPNGTATWNTLPVATTDSFFEATIVGLQRFATALHLPTKLLTFTQCIFRDRPQVCPALPNPPVPSSGGLCQYTSGCLGIVCCVNTNLGFISRSLKVSIAVDPCNFSLVLTFENWSLNTSLLTYQWGRSSTQHLSDAVRLIFNIDKSEDNRNLIFNFRLRLCLEDGCISDIFILEKFVALIPFCSNGTLLWPSVDEINEVASGLIVNSLGVSSDLLLTTSCNSPPNQITPTQTGCTSIQFPATVATSCTADQTCNGVGCCLELDLGVARRSFSIWMKLDLCGMTFTLGFENWVYTESLNAGFHLGIEHVKTLGNLRLKYQLLRPSSTMYHVDLSMVLCTDGSCKEPIIIIKGALFSVPGCSGGRRRRRQVEGPTENMESSMTNEEVSLNTQAKRYFANLLKHDMTILSAETNMMTTIDPGRKVPLQKPEREASRRQVGLFILEEEQEVQIPRKKRELSFNLGGEDIFGLLSDGVSTGFWRGSTVVGGGITEKGADALTRQIANMTIGELEAMLDLQNIDPLKALEVMREFRKLFRVLIEEVVDAVTSGKAGDIFQSFDVKLSGTITFPRKETTFFEVNFGILVGGFIWIGLYAGAGGFFGMDITVGVGIITMTAEGTVTPKAGAFLKAGARVCIAILCGELELNAAILNVQFPTTAEIGFSKFPLDVGIRMNAKIVPLTITLYGKVTLKLIFKTRTLYKKKIWQYKTPAIEGEIFNIHTKDPDKSPPQFMESTTSVSRKRQTGGVVEPNPTRECRVEQVPGLDYTEPAFQLEIAAGDDKSIVTFTYSVGSVPGGTDVVNADEFGGPSAIIVHDLKGGLPLYFTVTASNSGGGTSSVTCDIPTYDVTLPAGRIDPAFYRSSHPYILEATAVVHDDSEILTEQEAVGFGPGIWGDQIVPWTDAEKTTRTHTRGASPLYQYTMPRLGRLATSPIMTTTTYNEDICAQKCLDSLELCLSFNYEFGETQICELLREIEGPGLYIREFGLFHHFERLGLGHTVEFVHNSLTLTHNQLYYFNLQVLNNVGYVNIISSKPILTDFTTPLPGPLANVSDETFVHMACASFTHTKWERLCIPDTPLQNHRIIVDGPGSGTVFNGHVDLTDLLYTRANNYLSANWDGFHDDETGILGYMWASGLDVCEEDIVAYQDPHSHIYHMSEWTLEGLETGLDLPDGLYYISVRALNNVDFGGPMAMTVCHSTPLVIDNTPPIIYEIFNITYDTSTFLIGTNVNATDPESDLQSIHFALGQTPRDIAHLGWVDMPAVEFLSYVFQIPDGSYGWVKIRPVNNVDLRTVGTASYPILVDSTPPIAGAIYDGPIPGEDLTYTAGRREICTNWRNFYDPDSGISLYIWGIGTEPGAMDIVGPIEISGARHKYCERMTLQHKFKYYATLVAIHGGNDKLNVTQSSDGVIVDLTPPEAGLIIDGLDPEFRDLVYSSEAATITSQWVNYTDPESGIRDYKISVYRKHDNVDIDPNDFEEIHSPESVGPNASSIEWHHFHLHHKDRVYVSLETINGALESIHSRSNGYLVDLTAPKLRYLGDGENKGEDREYQTNADSISVNWDYYDDESGVSGFEVAVYEMRSGNKHKIYPQDQNSKSVVVIEDPAASGHTQDGLTLHQGATYIILVKSINNAKLVASHETTGIKVDTSPPQIQYVRAGTLDGEEEEVHNGYVYQSDKNGIQASWFARDGESGIYAYWVAVISDLDQKDTATYQAMGRDHDGYIWDLNLNLTNGRTCNNSIFTPNCRPVYYVCAKAENGAGAYSTVVCSSPIRVVEEDKIGYATDGSGLAEMLGENDLIIDIDAQLSTTTVTLQFTGFESQLYGLSHYEWAVGTELGMDNVQAFTNDGIVFGNKTGDSGPGLAGHGKAQSLLPLEHSKTYYSTIRAITGEGHVLESVTDGFTVDRTSPRVHIIDFAGMDSSGGTLELRGTQLYHDDANTLTAIWNTTEKESTIHNMYYSVGRYPGGRGTHQVTWTHNYNIPPSEIIAGGNGIPNFLTVAALNTVGLTGKLFSTSLTIDTSPPFPGMVECPRYLAANDILQCNIFGFQDPESGIDHCTFFVGSAEGYKDVYESPKIEGCGTSFGVPVLNLQYNKYYYVTIEAVNKVNQQVRAYSDAIIIDDTHPIGGAVVELSSEYYINGTVGFSPWERVNCADFNECLTYDTACLQSVSEVAIAWQPFTDPETNIIRYNIALGTAPGGTQLKDFYDVPTDVTKVIINNVDLTDVRKVYATVRGYNSAGLSSIATSNGAYISRYGAGLPPMKPIVVRDGYLDAKDLSRDIDFQTSLDHLSASWDFSGEPCPSAEYEWTAIRIDGQVYQPWINVGKRTTVSSDGIMMTDGETYYTIVKATNLIGLTMIYMSDGVTIQPEPLNPGNVYDGDLIGRDLKYQLSVDTISANWNGFGGSDVLEMIKHTGNDEIVHNSQVVDFYEAAVGTDRRYPKTRDNVVAFTNVGLNTSVTFQYLDLQPLTSVYYVTVRAYSASFSTAEVTSNGITPGFASVVTAGVVDVNSYVNSLTTVDIAWSDFESSLSMFFYYVGISSIKDAVTKLNCEHVLLVHGQDVYSEYDISTFTNVGLDTYLKITNLNLAQAALYFATVIGVDESGMCNYTTVQFTVDVTAASEGRLRIGPYYDMPVTYTSSFEFIPVYWEGYIDPESNVAMYNIRLLRASSCHEADENKLYISVDWIEIEAKYTSYQFVDLSLQETTPYFVEIEAVNGAGIKTTTRSSPILLDSSEPSAGFVVDGLDFRMDETYHGNQHQISEYQKPGPKACHTAFSKLELCITELSNWMTVNKLRLNHSKTEFFIAGTTQGLNKLSPVELKVGSFLHYANPEGDSCPQRLLEFTNPNYWTYLESRGLWNMDGAEWYLQYHKDQIDIVDDVMSIMLERDTQRTQMLTGGYVSNAAIYRGGKFMMDIKAAPANDANAVTGVVFWDGPSTVVGEFNLKNPREWQSDRCSCCFVRPFNESECWCNCTEYLPPEDTDFIETDPYKPFVEMNVEDHLIPRTACGFQLHPDGDDSEATVWCRYFRDEYVKIQRTFPIDFDPSDEWHTYTLEIVVYPTGSEQDQWELRLLIDDVLLTSLDGIPELSTSANFVIHVWNKDNIVTNLPDPLYPPNAVAYFRNLRAPPAINQPCRYGEQFRARGSPIITYMAGVGTAPGETDLVPFQEFLRPCIPCFQGQSVCQRYQCSDECRVTGVTPFTFTLHNITLPEGSVEYVNDTTGTTATAEYFVTVQAVAGNGKVAVASSNGVNMDITPPRLDYYFYLDVTQSGLLQQAPTKFQASSNTIRAFWGFVDDESEIQAYYWAIGSSPGSTNLQDFEFVGLNQTNTNSSFEGLLLDNQTYYVTVIARNGAGLETISEFDGVTVLLTPPPPDGVNSTVLFNEPFDKEVFPSDAKQTTNPSATGACWTKADDESVSRYDYCVGSSPGEDDIVQCIAVSNSSGCAMIINGKIEVTSDEYGQASYNLSDFIPPDGNGTFYMGSRFNMEPGKCLYTTLKVCNEASLCTVLSTGTVTIILDGDEIITSTNGSDIMVESSGARRRKRQAEDDFELSIETSGGLHPGGSVLFGFLDGDRAKQDFTSDASMKYRSYITDHLAIELQTERILRGRIKKVYEISFFLGSLGQIELQGPLMINITFETWDNSTDEVPLLLYWDYESSRWLDAGKTCSNTGTSYDESMRRISVWVCATRNSVFESSRDRSRRAVDESAYFSQETQFAVAAISPNIVNESPYFVNLVSSLTVDEDKGKLEYRLRAEDPDGDGLRFVLDHAKGRPRLGIASVSIDGLLTYTPCKDCNGEDIVNIAVEEVQSDAGITSTSTQASITVLVRSVNDNPFAFVAHRGQIGSTLARSAKFAVGQNTRSIIAYVPLMAALGAYDVDSSDVLTFVIDAPVNGEIMFSDEDRTVPINAENCNNGSETVKSFDERVVPCGLVLSRDKNHLSWVMVNFTYTPHMNFVGEDSFRFLAHDQDGAMSQSMIVYIDVYEPCRTKDCFSVFNLETAYYKQMYVDEGEEFVTITVNRTGYVDTPGVVVLDVRQGSAMIGSDFKGDQMTLHFTSGESRVSTQIDIVNDDEPEDKEEFFVSLNVLEGGIAGLANEITVTIFDDDVIDDSSQGPIVAAASGGLVALLLIIFLALLVYYRYRVLPARKAADLPADNLQDEHFEAEMRQMCYTIDSVLMKNTLVDLKTFQDEQCETELRQMCYTNDHVLMHPLDDDDNGQMKPGMSVESNNDGSVQESL
ncbi:LOW QUALITY PROTEIN: uncharacterized protein [Amphiura filiformis]|uniref:LOW QUALITY PROTEIN: uncharacterized protein n=1 Tax=Amphiura filiformis TaxID=82378 RepID=UPI003B21A5D6